VRPRNRHSSRRRLGQTHTSPDPVSGFRRDATTGSDGSFRFTNVPFNPYHLTVTATGFSTYTQDAGVRSTVPTTLPIGLKLGTANTSVTVEANGGDLARSGRCLSDRYINRETPLRWQCALGHRWYAHPGRVKRGAWCAKCANLRRRSRWRPGPRRGEMLLGAIEPFRHSRRRVKRRGQRDVGSNARLQTKER
jgi:hypothetical protein